MSTDIKLGKAQISKIIQSGGTFGPWLATLRKKAQVFLNKLIDKITFQYQMKARLEALMIALVPENNKFSINFSKANTTFCLSLHYNGDESYLYVNKTETNLSQKIT